MAPYMNEYYRARIKELSGDTVSVIFVDYGNSEEMSIGQVRQLLPEFRALENQVSVRSNQVSERLNSLIFLIILLSLLAFFA